MDATRLLSTEECWTMLRDQVLGRVAFSENAMPTILPLPYAVEGRRLLLRCDSERLAHLLDRQVVAFEVDDTLARHLPRKAVVVTGTAHEVPRVSGDDPVTVSVEVGRVTGQRLGRAA